MLFDLFLTFFMVGIVSFGGGYAMIPLIQQEVLTRHHWMDAAQLSDIVAVAGMSPGPIATNIAIAVGYHQAGTIGAAVASLAMILPSLALILIAGKLLIRYRNNNFVKSSFFGLRPIVAGMIVYAAFVFAQHSGITLPFDGLAWSQLLIFAGSLFSLVYLHKHPISVLLVSGLVGIAVYG